MPVTRSARKKRGRSPAVVEKLPEINETDEQTTTTNDDDVPDTELNTKQSGSSLKKKHKTISENPDESGNESNVEASKETSIKPTTLRFGDDDDDDSDAPAEISQSTARQMHNEQRAKERKHVSKSKKKRGKRSGESVRIASLEQSLQDDSEVLDADFFKRVAATKRRIVEERANVAEQVEQVNKHISFADEEDDDKIVIDREEDNIRLVVLPKISRVIEKGIAKQLKNGTNSFLSQLTGGNRHTRVKHSSFHSMKKKGPSNSILGR